MDVLNFERVGNVYQTTEDFLFDLAGIGKVFDYVIDERLVILGGMIFIPSGVAWNGSNVVKDGESCLVASLIHDLLCDYINKSNFSKSEKYRLRKMADIIYVETCVFYGMSRFRANIRGFGLSLNRLINF